MASLLAKGGGCMDVLPPTEGGSSRSFYSFASIDFEVALK